MPTRFLFPWLFLLIIASSCSKTKSFLVNAPNGEVKVTIGEVSDTLSYSIAWTGKEVIKSSKIAIFPDRSANILKASVSEFKEVWQPVWGQFSNVTNKYNELKLHLDHEGTSSLLYVRVYDDGVGFRFEINKDQVAKETSFYIEYGISGEDQLYMPAGEGEPHGPIKIDSFLNLKKDKIKWQMPLVVESSSGPYLSMLESDLISCPGFDVINFRYDKQNKRIVSENAFSAESGNLKTPWRVILLEEKLGDLVTNQVSLNLAEPNKITNSEWIKPGKAVWDWRVHGYTAKDGFTYGIDTESYLRFIEFASKNQIEYFLIDDAWYTEVSKNNLVPSPKLDLEKINRYAKEKGVDLILYYDRRKGDYGDKALFPLYQSMGMKGIKYGFMGPNVPFTREAIKLSAESKLLINFHDSPVPLTGVSRTFPNAITREYNHAQQDARRTFTPEAFIKMALINAIQGPLDMNNGIFDILGTNSGEREKGPKIPNSLLTTAVGEAARTLIIFSGIVCLPDAPEAYEEKSDLFEFIRNLPIGKWDETVVINAKMGEHITTARRSGQDWFVGSVSSKGGILEIPMDMLEDGKEYAVTLYEDTENTDSRSNPEEYRVRKSTLRHGDVIQANIAEGGGHCMWIKAL